MYNLQLINYDINKTSANSLFCIGTVADMAPMLGANRKWLKECLSKIHSTENYGIQAILNKLALNNIDISTNKFIISFKKL